MQTDDFKLFREGVAGVYTFYGKEVSSFALDVWWNALKVYDLAAIKDAFNRHLMNPDAGAFLPKPADIVRMLAGSSQDAALQAWAKVDWAVRTIGTYRDVAFIEDPLIHRVVHDMGGWIQMGTKTEQEWTFVAKEFENRYRGFRIRSDRPQYPPILTGMANADNARHGQPPEPPVLVGNPAKAKQFFANATEKPLVEFTMPNEAGLPLRIDDRNTDAA